MRYALCVLIAGFAMVEGALFTAPPELVKTGEGFNITFSVDAATDATVDILDAAGKIVRHIGSGLLGPKAPEPFLPNTLDQSIVWDGTDDMGNPLPDSGLVARVRLGLTMHFDRILTRTAAAYVPNYGASWIVGLAVDTARNFYVITGEGLGAARSNTSMIAKYSPQGRYLSTILPIAANADPATLGNMRLVSETPGRLEPVSLRQTGKTPFLNMHRMTAEMTKSGWLILVNGWSLELNAYGPPRSMAVIRNDGAVPRAQVLGPDLKYAGCLNFALNPAEDTVYYDGVWTFNRYADSTYARHVVWKVGLGINDIPVIFAGVDSVPGSDNGHFNQPRGIATDGNGNVYLSDCSNNRIQVFAPSGAYLATVPVTRPSVIRVHPVTGAIYVVTLTSPANLAKYSGYSNPALQAEYTVFSGTVDNMVPSMALDPYGDSAVIYLGRTNTYSPWGPVWRLADGGSSFVKSEPPDLSQSQKFDFAQLHTADRRNDVLYFLNWSKDFEYTRYRYYGSTGVLNISNITPKVTWGADGYFYAADYNVGDYLYRFNSAGTRVNFSSTGATTDTSKPASRWWGTKYNFAVTANGEMYGIDYGPVAGGDVTVRRFTPDGRLDPVIVIDTLPCPANMKTDSRGNLYFSDNLKSPFKLLPDRYASLSFLNALDVVGPDGNVGHGLMWETGSVLKFGNAGGRCRQLGVSGAPAPGETLLVEGVGEKRYAVSGLKGYYFGMQVCAINRVSASQCWCDPSTFDIDLYDRIVIPDAYSVTITDANFNVITKFGEYDNWANYGGDAAAAEDRPSIPFGGGNKPIMELCATDDAIYVNDWRITRTVPSYALEGRSDGFSSVAQGAFTAGKECALEATPNPFNPSLRIKVIHTPGQALTVGVYDISGRRAAELFSGKSMVSPATFAWDGSGFASGLYVVRVSQGRRVFSQTVVLAR